MPIDCIVCNSTATRVLVAADNCDYWRCDACEATFMDPARMPTPEAERARYLLHRNDPADAGYREFLSTLANPLLQRLEPRREGLDYGCGPGPVLAMMLREAGHRVDLFDPFFFPDPAPLSRCYDFITCTETVEHFHSPAVEFDRLDRMLRPGGWLAIMTRFQQDDSRFADWDYRKDFTHVVFYREATLRHIAAGQGWSCEIPAGDIALMRKQ